MKTFRTILIIFLVFVGFKSIAQVDSLSTDSLIVIPSKENVKTKKTLSRHSPKKALILSLALPGAGQIYNRKYWKLPIVYGGLGALGYLSVYNGRRYTCYRRSYLAMVDSDPLTVNTCDPNLSQSEMKLLRDNYQRFYEFSVVGMVGFYLLVAADAFVDAHLMDFDISDDLSLKIKPSFEALPSLTPNLVNFSTGLGLEFQIGQKNKSPNKSFF